MGDRWLSLHPEGKFILFKCTDTGPGIPCVAQKQLFKRFVQRGGAPGTGLGLAIAKTFVDLMNGSICFQSDPTIKPGTTCLIKLPLPRCNAPDVIKESPIKKIEEPLSFLIIDDITMNRSMLIHRIRHRIAPNAKFKQAVNGEEALEICNEEVFDVIVVDQFMEESGGKMLGTDVVAAMRKNGIKSMIIGCSGNDIEDVFKNVGSDWFWSKPIPSDTIILEQLRIKRYEN